MCNNFKYHFSFSHRIWSNFQAIWSAVRNSMRKAWKCTMYGKRWWGKKLALSWWTRFKPLYGANEGQIPKRLHALRTGQVKVKTLPSTWSSVRSSALFTVSSWLSETEGPFLLLSDIARCHHDPPGFCENPDIRFLPYVEYAGSCLKSHVKQIFRCTRSAGRCPSRSALIANETLQARRLKILKREIAACIPNLTPEKCFDF